jgi:hypothetical protein
MGLVIASIHERRDEYRKELNRPDAVGGRGRGKLRDAARQGDRSIGRWGRGTSHGTPCREPDRAGRHHQTQYSIRQCPSDLLTSV